MDDKINLLNGKLFNASDLNFAAFSCCRSFPVRRITPIGSRVVFCYADSPQLQEAILDYFNEGRVPARTFCNALRDLKGVAQSEKGSGNGTAEQSAPLRQVLL